MTVELTTTIGKLSINGGKWRKNGPNQVAVREPRAADAPGAGKGDLFIITEVQGDGDNLETLEQQLAETIRDNYYLARGSITASLRRAIQSGSDLLYQRNRNVPVDERVAGGAVVLVLSHEDAFVAFIGPAAFFAILGDHIQRYPGQSIWLDEPFTSGQMEEDVTVLGLSQVVEPGLQHLRVTAQDILILADSRLAGQLPLKDVVKSVVESDVNATIKKLGEAAQARTCSALVLEVTEQTSSGALKLTAPAQLSQLWQRQKQTDPDIESVRAAQPDPKPMLEAVEEAEGTFASTSVMRPSMMQKPLRWLGGFGSKPAATLPLPEPENPVKRQLDADIEQWFGNKETTNTDWDNPAKSHKMDAIGQTNYGTVVEEEVEGSGIGKVMHVVLLPVILVGSAISSLFGRLKSTTERQEPRQAGMQAQHQPTTTVPWKMLRNIAIAIPLLVALIVSISYIQKGRVREAEYQEHITAAQNKFEQAKSVEGAAALGLMAEAETALLQAEQIKQNQPEITAMREKIASETDRVGNVQRLHYLPQLRQYTDAGTDMQSIVVEGVELYVMDTGNDRIYHHRLDDVGTALLPDDETVLMTAKGQPVEAITVGDLLGMTWMPIGGNRQTSDLVILNSTGLLEFNPNWGIAPSALAAGDGLKKPVAVESYFGNFYILDTEANALFRYLPTADGYSEPPQNYFTDSQAVNLSSAADVAIDGAVYILYQDGRIDKFLSGQQAEFNLTGLDVPFNHPVAIHTAPDETMQHIYVADAGNRRIVQLNKDGSFVRQFKPRPGEAVSFSNLQDIYVDEIGGRIFVLDNNSLYLGTLPTE